MSWCDPKVIAIPGMLLFGTSTVVISKALFSMSGVSNEEGDTRNFNKPWAQTDAMFVGMMACLVVHNFANLLALCVGRKTEEETPLLAPGTQRRREQSQKGTPWSTYLLVAVPSMFDLVATILANIGLQWISASVWQMLRGAMVIFSAILSIVFLNRKFYLFNWVGIAFVMGALCMVGVSCLHQPAPASQGEVDSSKMILGVSLVVGAQLVQASQIVCEEFLLKNLDAPPMLIVGMEGFWGTIITSFIFLPLFQHLQVPGFSEDTVESLYMLAHNPHILMLFLLYMVVILLYNATAMMVTNQFSAVHRTILEVMRTLLIWIVNLFIFYEVSDKFGEQWTIWSWFELLGFVLLFVGMFIFNEVIELPSWLGGSSKRAQEEAIQAHDTKFQMPPQSPRILSPRM